MPLFNLTDLDARLARNQRLLGIDLGDGGGVGAADVVGLDLEAGDGVRMGALGDQQVARLLEGVGLLRTARGVPLPSTGWPPP